MSTTWVVSLGRFSTGLNLAATFLDTAGIEVGTAVVEALGNGRYIITEDVPTGAAVIVVRDTDRDAVVQVGAVQAVGGAIYRPRPQYTYRMGPRMILGGVI